MNFIVKLLQCLFCWRIKPDSEEKVKNADVIIGQSFGLRQDGPGKSNEALAKIVRGLNEKYKIPLVLQWEIADCLPDLPIFYVTKEHRIKGEYLDTYEVLFQAKTICKKRGWKKAIILAHSDHHWRCMMVAKKLEFELIAIDTSSVPYDELSTQSWTKSVIRFIPREIVARIVYLLTDRI